MTTRRRAPQPQPREEEERAQTPPLPAYEPPLAPLNETGRAALLALLRNPALRQLKTHIQHAGLKLTDSAGEVNERLTEARERDLRQRERERKNRARAEDDENGNENGDGDGDGDGNEGATGASSGAGSGSLDIENGSGSGPGAERLRALEESVQDVTARLEVQMRRAIDAEVRVDGLSGVLGALQGDVEREMAGGGGGGGDGEPVSLSRRLEERLSGEKEKWEGLSLTERYSKNNSYIGFYRIIHEAKHPGDDIPPLPHASTWFAHLEDPTAASRKRSRDEASRSGSGGGSSSATLRTNPSTTTHSREENEDEDDEIAIESERLSLRCPLTLLPFRDPVTSTKCPHSFEREAITSMINQSTTKVPDPAFPAPPAHSAGGVGRGPRPPQIKAVKCPVCTQLLTVKDLREDPVLVRRVRRAEAAMRRDQEEEEEEEEEELGGSSRKKGRKSGITLASDDENEEEEEGASGSAVKDERDVDAERVRIKLEGGRSQGSTAAGGDEDEDSDSDGDVSSSNLSSEESD